MSDQQNYCYCNQTTIVKKGFSGTYAILGFIGGIIISSLLLKVLYPNGNPVDPIYYPISSIFSTLCLFAGTIDMNDLFSVCHKCGKITPLN